MTAASARELSSIAPLALDAPAGRHVLDLIQHLPVLSQLVRGDDGPAVLGELVKLVGVRDDDHQEERAARYRSERVVRISVKGRLLDEIGIVRDFSATGARISFQRSASFDAIQHDVLTLNLRLPSRPEQVVSVEASLVRLAANHPQEVQLAFRFTDSQSDPFFDTLLEEIASRSE